MIPSRKSFVELDWIKMSYLRGEVGISQPLKERFGNKDLRHRISQAFGDIRNEYKLGERYEIS